MVCYKTRINCRDAAKKEDITRMKEILELSDHQFTITMRNMLWTLMEKVDNMKQ